MGLDQYLTRKTYIGNRFDFVDARVELSGKDMPAHINPQKIDYIIESVGVWRKANAIHNWFVQHVQDGVDECDEYPVSFAQLRELLRCVEQVLASAELVDPSLRDQREDVKRRLAGQEHEQRIFQHEAEDLIKSAFGGGEVVVMGEGYRPEAVLGDTSIAEALLPTTDGFFFGSTAYDEWYVNDLRLTKRILEDALSIDEYAAQYFYRASW